MKLDINVDWVRVGQLRVTSRMVEGLKNLDISSLYLIRSNRRKDAKQKHMGHGSKRLMLDSETPFLLDGKRQICDLIQQTEKGQEKCKDCFAEVIEGAMSKKGFVSKECHAGMIETACPVTINGNILGVFRMGEFAQGEKDSVLMEKIKGKISDLGIKENKVDEACQNIPFFSSDKYAIVKSLFLMMTDEIGNYLRESNREHTEASQEGHYNYSGIITKNEAVLDIIKQIKMIGTSDSSVIIYGESGTGKELLSKLIHENSSRKSNLFVTINCAALTETLLEAELFGYRKGAFTGAFHDKKGLFEVANKGTIFLDEVGEMSLALQVKILRLIQEGTFMRVGDTEMKEVDVRVVSATHRDLKKLIEEAKFREDLYYRLAVVELNLPPLRDRVDDIPILIRHFLGTFQQKTGKEGIKLSTDAISELENYYWPGNIRELRNEIERIVALKQSHTLVKPRDLSKKFFYENYPDNIKNLEELGEGSIKNMVDDFEKSLISSYLRKYGWNKTKVATLCGITRQGLNKKITKYKLDRRKG